jgi:hypothetical protein
MQIAVSIVDFYVILFQNIKNKDVKNGLKNIQL